MKHQKPIALTLFVLFLMFATTTILAEPLSNSSDITIRFGHSGGFTTSGERLAGDFSQRINELPTDIPTTYSRNALELLQELRGSPLAPNWTNAQLGSDVRYLLRPDLPYIAYYEYPVVIPDGSYNSPAGFIIVSTADHDYTIPHWSNDGVPPTQQLDNIAAANYEIPYYYYKISSLSYIAEDQYGNQVAALGDQPARITGLNNDWVNNPPQNTVNEWSPNSGASSSGPTYSGVSFSSWDSWSQLKQNYGDSYQVILDAQQQEASVEWKTQQYLDEYGQVVAKGDFVEKPLMYLHGTLYLDGPGLDYVNITVKPASGNELPILQIDVLDDVIGEKIPFTIEAQYDNDVQETLKFMIVGQEHVYLPTVMNGNSLPKVTTVNNVEQVTDWGPWQIYWAGTATDQRWYGQIPAYSPPYYYSCASGCGATAWAMLYGWADYRASLNDPSWYTHWGIYRQDGLWGNNAVAPWWMDDGVKNIVWEIRNYLGTWCNLFNENGATNPEDMWLAYQYLNNRAAVSVQTQYNYGGALPSWVGGNTFSVADVARDSIVYNQTPVIVGIGNFLQHYALAYGYATRQNYRSWWEVWQPSSQSYFYVNQGHGYMCGANQWCWTAEWVSSKIWFVGQIIP